MATLYELTNDWKALLELAEDPEVDEEILNDTLSAIDGEIEAKADGYAMVIQQLQNDVDALKYEEKRLASRRTVIEGNIKRMKNNLQEAMETIGKTKFKTTLFSFGIQNNPASVVIDDVTNVPQSFLIPQEPKIDKAMVKDLLKETKVPWAHLEQSKGLRIR